MTVRVNLGPATATCIFVQRGKHLLLRQTHPALAEAAPTAVVTCAALVGPPEVAATAPFFGFGATSFVVAPWGRLVIALAALLAELANPGDLIPDGLAALCAGEAAPADLSTSHTVVVVERCSSEAEPALSAEPPVLSASDAVVAAAAAAAAASSFRSAPKCAGLAPPVSARAPPAFACACTAAGVVIVAAATLEFVLACEGVTPALPPSDAAPAGAESTPAADADASEGACGATAPAPACVAVGCVASASARLPEVAATGGGAPQTAPFVCSSSVDAVACCGNFAVCVASGSSDSFNSC